MKRREYCAKAAQRLFESWGLVWSEHYDEYWNLVEALERAYSKGQKDAK